MIFNICMYFFFSSRTKTRHYLPTCDRPHHTVFLALPESSGAHFGTRSLKITGIGRLCPEERHGLRKWFTRVPRNSKRPRSRFFVPRPSSTSNVLILNPRSLFGAEEDGDYYETRKNFRCVRHLQLAPEGAGLNPWLSLVIGWGAWVLRVYTFHPLRTPPPPLPPPYT